MHISQLRSRDPRIKLSTALKVERLQRKIDRLIARDIAAHERAQVIIATDGVPRTVQGFPDRRTKAYRALREAKRLLDGERPLGSAPVALDAAQPPA